MALSDRTDPSRAAWTSIIIRARTAKGWTQTDLARAIGVQQSAIAKLESGDRDPRLSTMVAVCRALGIAELCIPVREDAAAPATGASSASV